MSTCDLFSPYNHSLQSSISLLWLVDVFLKAHPDIATKKLSSNDIVSQYIKPDTDHLKCSYSDLLEVSGIDSTLSRGRAFYFCSHTWGTPFIDMIDQLTSHFSPENQAIWRPKGAKILDFSEIFLFIDILVMNQHKPEDVEFGTLLVTLKETVQYANEIFMILDADGIILTRIWCLYEAWHAGRKLKNGHTSFLKLLAYGLKWGSLEQVFIDLDVSKAKASVKHDLDAILADIESDVGVLTMTHQLKDALVNSIVLSIADDDDEHPWNEKLGMELSKAGDICKLYGRLSDAEPFLRRNFVGSMKILGQDHPTTLKSLNDLTLLHAQGKLSEAEPLYRSTIATKIMVLGQDHPDKLASMNNLAGLLHARGKLSEAESLYRKTLEARIRLTGQDHPSTLGLMNNLAGLLLAQGKLSEAESLYRRNIETKIMVLGKDHPETLTSMGNLAGLLQEQGKLSEAEPLYRSTLETRIRVLGQDHPSTLISMGNLASLLKDQGHLHESSLLFTRAVERCEIVLGKDHQRTLSLLSHLADLYRMGGQLDKSEQIQLRALEGGENTLGADHPRTLLSVHRLAAVYISKGMRDVARPLCIRAVDGRRKVLGSDHKDTIDSEKLLEVLGDGLLQRAS